MSKCGICGADLPPDNEQLKIITEKNGVEGVCLCHAFTPEVYEYIEQNGGTRKCSKIL